MYNFTNSIGLVIVIFLTSLFVFIGCSVQENEITSLNDDQTPFFRTELDSVNSLIDQGKTTDAAIILDSLLVIAESERLNAVIPQIIASRGLIDAIQGQFVIGVNRLEKYLVVAESYASPNTLYLYRLRLATLYSNSGQSDKALTHIDLATENPPNDINDNYIFGGLVTKAGIYTGNYQFAQSIDIYQQAIRYANERDTLTSTIEKSNIAIAHNNLGLLLHRLKRFDEAIAEFEKSIAINTSISNDLGLSQNYNNIANSYVGQDSFETANEYLLQAVQLNQENRAYTSLVRNYYNLGSNFEKLSAFDDSYKYYRDAYNMSSEAGFLPGIMYNAYGIASIYFERGEYQDALAYANEALELADSSSTLELKVEIQRLLAKIYEASNNFSTALEFLNSFNVLNDSLREATYKIDIEEVRSGYQFELLESENNLLEQQLFIYELQVRRQLMYLLILVISILAIAISLYIYSRKNKQINQKNLQLEELYKEKDMLTKVIVHDMRNPLTGIHGALDLLMTEPKITQNQKELLNIAYRSSMKLKDMINGLLEVSRMKEEQISNEFEFAKTELICNDVVDSLKTFAATKNITISTSIVECSIKTYSPYLHRIIENLLSNAIKFSPKNSIVQIVTTKTADKSSWIVQIIDLGPGFTENDLTKAFGLFQKLSANPTNGEESTGLGLYTVSMLTEKLGGTVTISENYPTGSIISCEFPLDQS